MIRPAILLISFLIISFQAIAQIPHSNRSDYAVYDPTGSYIAIAGTDLLLLDRRSKEKKLLNTYSPLTTSISFSNDGTLIAAEDKKFGIYIYDVENPRKTLRFFQGIKKKNGVQSRIKFSPDNKYLATSNSEKVVIYHITEGNVGKIALSIPIESTNSHRSLAAFDASDDWKTFFFNMQIIHLEMSPKLSYKYGRKLSWERSQTVHSLISADGSKVAVSARSGLDQKIFDVKSGAVLYENKDLKTYALAANKDFSKIYMNQAVWDLKSKTMKILYQTKNIDKNTKETISVAKDNEDFLIGLYQYNKDARLKNNLQHSVISFNRVSISKDTVTYYRDYAGNKRYDSHSANIKEGLRGRSARNITNKNTINTALATSQDGTYGISHLARIIRRSNMTVSAPIFRLGSQKGIAADISSNNTLALANRFNIFTATLGEDQNNLAKAKKTTIKLKEPIEENATVKLKVSPDGEFIALAYSDSKLDPVYNTLNYQVKLFDISGKLIKSIKTSDIGALTFSNNSDRLYYSSDKRLVCYSMVRVDGKAYWDLDDAYSWYTESGAITAIALNKDDNILAYCASNGHNKVVHARLGNDIIKCTMTAEEKLEVSK